MTPKHTRESINRIGKWLVADDLTPEQRAEVIDLFNDWRALHFYPLNTFQASLRKYVKEIDPKHGIVAQRLKRMPTIIDKLKNRHRSMKLGQLQDVGGLRAIVSDVARVRMLEKKYDKSRAKHKLLRKYDYITNPKESGYRGIHFVYAYSNAKRPDCDGLYIEIQLRTRLQHLWATAVETVGMFLQESLKSSQGSPMWLGFFRIVSALFAYEEKELPHEEYRKVTYQQLLKLFKNFVDENSVFASLQMIQAAESVNQSPGLQTAEYIVLSLHPKTRKVVVVPIFGHNNEQFAQTMYKIMERDSEYTVLVSVDSLQKIKQAYPNFFLNITDFSKELKRLYDAAG